MPVDRSTKLTLQGNDVHLWVTYPRGCKNPQLLARYNSVLSKEESARQQKYHFKKDQHDALVTRAFVRDLLSYYIDISPSDLIFTKGRNGKPEINDPPIPLRFNISHTNNMIICGVMLNDDIGCDVEDITRDRDVLSIANRYFSKKEVASLFDLPDAFQRNRFFDYWTLKESYVKACGLGLSIPLEDFSFHIGNSPSMKYNDNIQLSFPSKRIDYPEDWHSWLFYPSDEHRIALSIRSLSKVDRNTNKSEPYNIRFFESIPFSNFKEISYY